jgi:phosphatidylinositol glycan class W
MHENYKSAKEAFVSNMTGSSVGHLNLLSLAALVRSAIYMFRRVMNSK